ncbi:DUF342 domain-containing protein [Ammoniphilus sp. YIM 78166]|uniref:DUF342 domain-containing protein n=1 Tax=Ammoniphilus sp. YIM 78166 TaxID=1644106 RepID=UPI001070059E|nr:FapA family protein [Ammoniphilus sp. YIM 78166]
MPKRITKELKRLIQRFSSSPNTQEEEPQVSSRPQNGSVQIQGGVIEILEPSDGGEDPIIEAKEPIQLFINGIQVSRPVRIISEDRIEWKVKISPLYTIDLSEDQMKAYLRVHQLHHYEWRLSDQPAQHHLILHVEANLGRVVDSLTMEVILSQLEQMGIQSQVDKLAIQGELEHPTFEKILIARGVEPISGTDANVEVYFSLEEQSYLEEINGKVNYREHHHIPMVQEGELMARKIPKKDGLSGRNLFGKAVSPKPVKDFMLATRGHVELRENGEVYALKPGRPRMMGDAVRFFDVCTSYIVQGNVDMNTGNILFIGDVVIYGDVMDGMTVEAMGRVIVHGNAYHATIAATGGIQVQGNAVSSRLYSGLYGVDYSQLYMELKKVSEPFASLLEAIQMIRNHLHENKQAVTISRVVQTLVDHKYMHLIPMFQRLISLVHTMKSPAENEFLELNQRLELFLKPHGISTIRSIDELYAIQEFLAEMRNRVRQYQEKKATIEVRQCHHSSLKATGDIRIKQEGMIQSDLFTEGNVVFYDQNSVCRGGVIIAEGSISAMTVGGEGNGQIQLTAGHRILAEKMTEGRICIGRSCRDITSPLFQLKAYVRNDELVVDYTVEDQKE